MFSNFKLGTSKAIRAISRCWAIIRRYISPPRQNWVCAGGAMAEAMERRMHLSTATLTGNTLVVTGTASADSIVIARTKIGGGTSFQISA